MFLTNINPKRDIQKTILAFSLILIIACIPKNCPKEGNTKNLLAGSEKRIEKYRKRRITITVLDKFNKPCIGQTVKIQMTNHQFLFGCNLFMFDAFQRSEENEKFFELWSKLFNYATIPFYMGIYSPTESQNQKDRIKRITSWCRKRGVVTKGHPLLYHIPLCNPDWLPDDKNLLQPILEKWVKTVIKEFDKDITWWDVINEATIAWFYDTPIAKWENAIGNINAALLSLEWVNSTNCEAKCIINDYNVKSGYWIYEGISKPFRTFQAFLKPNNTYIHSYYKFLSDIIKNDGQFQAVGIQSHMHMRNWDIIDVWNIADCYATLGRPVHFTEVTVLSGKHKIINEKYPQKNLPWHSTFLGEKNQSEYLKKFYTILFSHPSVEAITWWDFCDRNAWMGAPGGLVRSDFSTKPAFRTLYNLIKNQWWTNLRSKTDNNGTLSFRGFCGNYDIQIDGLDRKISFFIDCLKDEEQAITIH